MQPRIRLVLRDEFQNVCEEIVAPSLSDKLNGFLHPSLNARQILPGLLKNLNLLVISRLYEFPTGAHLLVNLLARTEARDLYVDLFDTVRSPPAGSCSLQDRQFDGFAHVKHEDLASLAHRRRLQHKGYCLRYGHEISAYLWNA